MQLPGLLTDLEQDLQNTLLFVFQIPTFQAQQ
jgi:hypothetical protein